MGLPTKLSLQSFTPERPQKTHSSYHQQFAVGCLTSELVGAVWVPQSTPHLDKEGADFSGEDG